MKTWRTNLVLPAKDPSSFWKIVVWWERRRIAYNLVIGAVGIVSLTVYVWLWSEYIQKPGDDGDFTPMLAVIGFGTLANLFYTSGWIVEGFALAIRKHGSPTIGPRLFKLGLLFSIVLASLSGLVLLIEVAAKTLHS